MIEYPTNNEYDNFALLSAEHLVKTIQGEIVRTENYTQANVPPNRPFSGIDTFFHV